MVEAHRKIQPAPYDKHWLGGLTMGQLQVTSAQRSSSYGIGWDRASYSNVYNKQNQLIISCTKISENEVQGLYTLLA